MHRVLLIVLALVLAAPLTAQVEARLQQTESRVATVEARLARLENRVRAASAAGAVAFLFGAFCALWAQNTGRSGWLWFFLGLFFSVIAVLVLLAKNSGDIDQRGDRGRRRFNLQEHRQQ